MYTYRRRFGEMRFPTVDFKNLAPAVARRIKLYDKRGGVVTKREKKVAGDDDDDRDAAVFIGRNLRAVNLSNGSTVGLYTLLTCTAVLYTFFYIGICAQGRQSNSRTCSVTPNGFATAQ